jgi:glycosyltransferase involved in cell wall biosynthesis
VYNPGLFLGRSLASVLAQQAVDLEVIVVDDGSIQNISGTAGLEDPRVRLVRTPNRGVSAARNLAVALARSDYVAFLDQGDEWASPQKLARQVSSHDQNPDASFVHTGFTWVLPDREEDASQPETVTTLAANLAGQGYVCLSSILVRRDHYVTVGGHDIFLAQQQDWDLVLKLLRTFGPAVALTGSLVRYHVHGGNASGNYVRGQVESDEVYRRHRTDEFAGLVRSARARANRLYASQGIDAARQALDRGGVGSAVAHLMRAGRIYPPAVPKALWRAAVRRLP